MAQRNHLSNREEEVVKLLLQGKSNKLIAASLGISERTVEFHLKNIYVKFQVSSRVELVLKLGDSAVAHNRDIAENRARPGSPENWVTSLKEAVSRIGKELKMENVANSQDRGSASAMTFYESIRVCLTKYAEFNGRASRSEFWWFVLFVMLGAGALAYLSEALGNVFLIAMLLPILAAGTRRLRDSGKSGWWQLFLLAPVAGIALLGIMWALPPVITLPDDTLPA